MQASRQAGKPENRLTSLGQSILEYAVLLAIVAAAFMTMSFYIRRAVQGKIYAFEGMATAKSNQTGVPSWSSGGAW